MLYLDFKLTRSSLCAELSTFQSAGWDLGSSVGQAGDWNRESPTELFRCQEKIL